MQTQITPLLLLVAFCATFVGAGTFQRLAADNGQFHSPENPNSEISSTHLIKTRPNRLVALRFDVLDLGPDDSVMIRDGRRSTLYRVYKRQLDRTIQLSFEDTERYSPEREPEVVEEPVRFDSTSGRVFVSYYTRNSGNKRGFRATYETYPRGMCQVDDLNINDPAPACDEITMSKVATRCSHTLRCQSNYTTYGEAVCIDGVWTDNAECLPDETLVEQCFTEDDALTDCAFSSKELIKFYAKMEESSEVFENEESGLGRSFGWSKKCTDKICHKRGHQYTLNCRRRFARRPRLRRACMICRLIFCGRSIQSFA